MSDTLPPPRLVEDLSLIFRDTASVIPLWIQVAGASTLLAAGVAGSWMWQHRRAERRARQALNSSFLEGPPERWALIRLAALRQTVDTIAPHPFASEVSEVLRVFLERRFDLRAAHQSTEEFLLDARERDALSRSQQESVREFLSCCDEAKFARRTLASGRKRDLLDSAVRLVREAGSEAAPDAACERRMTSRLPAGREKRGRLPRAAA